MILRRMTTTAILRREVLSNGKSPMGERLLPLQRMMAIQTTHTIFGVRTPLKLMHNRSRLPTMARRTLARR